MKPIHALRAISGAIAAVFVATACIAPRSYVDTALGDVPAAERARFAKAEPVQLMFEFQTNGRANAQATKYLDPQVKDAVTRSGLFTEVSATPVGNGALLSVVINNVPEENAGGQGFVTGLTFGAAGSAITDFYIATGKFVPSDRATPISAEAKHALHTVIGAKEAPANAVAAKDMNDGVATVVRQLMDHLLNGIAKQAGNRAAPEQSAMTDAPTAH